MAFLVRELREKLNLTQVELCKRADISRQTLISIESGEEINVQLTTLQKLAKALDCQVQDLLRP